MLRLALGLFYLMCLICGQLLAVRSWDGIVYVYMGEERSPAAVRALSDYVPIEHDFVRLAPPAQILYGARIRAVSGTVEIALGNPLLRNPAGRMTLACPSHGRPGLYNKIELTFTQDGIAESGEVSRRIFTADCHAKEAPTKMSALKIPWPNVVGPAPGEWVVTRVRLFHDAEGTESNYDALLRFTDPLN